jgi:hypothetical protein
MDSGSSKRADLGWLLISGHGLIRHHIPPQERLGHRIDLVVMRAVGKGCTLLNQIIHPRGKLWVRKVDIAGLNQRTDGGGARHLAESYPRNEVP